jgi:hypothetical protein
MSSRSSGSDAVFLTGRIQGCWSGSVLPQPVEWRVTVVDGLLTFDCAVPGTAWCDTTIPPGTFVEGLWEQDVAELFLMDGSGAYQEFNVSPAGAWWSCVFSAYRQRKSPQPPPPRGVSVRHLSSPERWMVQLQVGLPELAVSWSPQTALHLAVIQHQPVQRFLSSRPVPGVEADFHRAECFESVTTLGNRP